ncbi:hypothetical protein [Streptomyces caniscabiei]|uniref:hypothetical protein n=1 Tax=Streptomyces caniscabiei TaxID=2746961 RepID=UPI0038F6FE56
MSMTMLPDTSWYVGQAVIASKISPMPCESFVAVSLSSTPADLVATTAENAGVRKTATGDLPTPPANVAKLRPRAARILPDA